MSKSAQKWTEFVVYELLFMAPYLFMVYAWDKGLLPRVKPGDPGFALGFALGFSVFLLAAALLRLARWIASLSASRQPFDLTGVDSLSDKDPWRKRLNLILLAAIRDGRTRLRLEPSKHLYRVYGTNDDAERELVPLDREAGGKVITALKVFAGQNAVGNAESGTQVLPILVGGHAVTLSLQSLHGDEGEGVSLGIKDHSLKNASSPGDAVTLHSADPASRFRKWIEGIHYVDDFQQELQAWTKQIGIRLDDSCSIDPGGQAESDASKQCASRENTGEA
jgi:hypothetical protein